MTLKCAMSTTQKAGAFELRNSETHTLKVEVVTNGVGVVVVVLKVNGPSGPGKIVTTFGVGIVMANGLLGVVVLGKLKGCPKGKGVVLVVVIQLKQRIIKLYPNLNSKPRNSLVNSCRREGWHSQRRHCGPG